MADLTINVGDTVVIRGVVIKFVREDRHHDQVYISTSDDDCTLIVGAARISEVIPQPVVPLVGETWCSKYGKRPRKIIWADNKSV